MNDIPENAKTSEADKGVLRRILVVIDDSEVSESALQYALNLAERAQSSLHVAYVVDLASLDYLQKMKIFITEERELLEAELEMRGKRRLQDIKTAASSKKLEVSGYLLHGRVNQVVLQAVQELEIDTVIIGGWKNTSTRKDTSAIERQLILDQASCPVLVVK